MSFAYLTLYTGDYLRDTRHLSCAEHGIYLLLLMHCWDSRGPVPLDERKQAGICGARSGDEIEALRRVLCEFFTRMDDGHYNKRMQREIERAGAISNARQHAAFTRHKGRDANAMQVHSKSNALDTNTTTTITTNTTTNASTSTSTDTTKAKVKNIARGARLSIEELPEEWRQWTASKNPALNAYAVFESFRDYWQAAPGSKGLKADWFATWRNWCRNQKGFAVGGKTSMADEMEAFKAMVLNKEKDITHE